MSFQCTYPLADDDQFQQPLDEDGEDKNLVAFHGLSWLLLLQPMLSDEKPQAETGLSMTMNYKFYSFISSMTMTIDINLYQFFINKF